ncbi:MAG TPA: DUF5946 family protein [Anaerolineales bacterium]|nr:DUF5946 family protein [Anaerolineales bacterium]
MATGSCPDCGAPGVDGREGCQALFDETFGPAHPELAAVRDLAFDAYCMQHLERYCRSAKSYAAHLTRLCCGLEYRGEPRLYTAIQKWLNGSVLLEKPALLPFLGKLTIADAPAVGTAEARREFARVWAESVWAAYASRHGLAHGWLEAAAKMAGRGISV